MKFSLFLFLVGCTPFWNVVEDPAVIQDGTKFVEDVVKDVSKK